MYTMKEIVNKGSRKLESTLTESVEKTLYSKKVKGDNNDILIVRLDGIGDYILFRNFIEELFKDNKEKGKLVLCGNILWKDLAEKLDAPFIREFIWVDVPKLHQASYRFAVYRKLQKAKCGTLLNPVYSRTADGDKLALHSGVRRVIGYNGDEVNISHERKIENDKRYSELVPSSQKNMFEFYRNKYFFEKVLGKELKIQKPSINSDSASSEEKKHILIFPGAGQEYRKWPSVHFAQLCKSISEKYKLSIIIGGSKSDSVSAKEIISKAGVSVTDNTGKSDLVDSIELIKKAALVIANDTGLMHLSVALNSPTICITNGNNYKRFCPYPDELNATLKVVLPDEFENKISDKQVEEKLLGKESHLDMGLIKPKKVFKVVKEILG